jgi:hypothetical protein
MTDTVTMTGSAQLQDVNPPPAAQVIIQVFSHSDEATYPIRQLAQGTVTEHTGTITTEGHQWTARFASTDDALQAAIAMQRATDLFNFDNGSPTPVLLGVHIGSSENNTAILVPPAFLRPGEIHLSESAYRAIHHDLIQDSPALKFRTVDHASTTAYRVVWKLQEFELASPTHHQGAPSTGFFVKLVLICLIPFLLVLAYTWREPLQHGLSSLDGTRTIDHQLQ